MQVLTAFIVEQIIGGTLAVCTIILFSLQLVSEKYQLKRLQPDNIKYKLHRIGLVCVVLMLVYSVDPFGVQGIYPPAIGRWFGALVTAVILCGIIVLCQATLEVTYRTRLEPV